MKYGNYGLVVLLFWTNFVLSYAQKSANNPLIGRWEVLQYAEQGLQVDKKQPAAPQALAVYRHVQKTRAKTWYGFDYDYADEYSRRRSREFQRWGLCCMNLVGSQIFPIPFRPQATFTDLGAAI
jgi:hypothetical protein